MVLTLHLKRFSPMGRKIGHPVRYDERLSLQPVMSEGHHGPTYSLYGVISHAGGGPNSGHYYAHIKDGSGNWSEMNDDSVSRHSGPPLDMKNAYILFYMRDRGQALEAAVATPRPTPKSTPVPPLKTGIVAGMKKRKVVDGEDENTRQSSPKQRRFIGPLLPPAAITPPPVKPDPQAEVLKKKISEKQAAPSVSPVKPSNALLSLSQYSDDDDDDDVGQRVSSDKPLPGIPDAPATPPPADPPESASVSSPSMSTPTPSVTPASQTPISTQSFYASSLKSESKKWKHYDQRRESSSAAYARSPIKHSLMQKHRRKMKGVSSPFNRLTGGNTLGGTSPRKRSRGGRR
jgi:ubiquitin carboxyl-terminal hydrolase 36/42